MKKKAVSCVLSLWLGATNALATPTAGPEGVRLVLPPCKQLPFDSAQLLDLLRLELQAVGIRQLETLADVAPSAPPGPEGVVVVTVGQCDPTAQEIELRLLDSRSGRSADRTMHVADIPPELRPRAIAIRIVELIRDSWPDLAADPAHEQGPDATVPVASRAGTPSDRERTASPAAAPVAPRTPTAKRPPFSLEAAIAASVFPGRSTALLGPRAALAFDRDHWRVSIGAHTLFAEQAVSTGNIDMGWASGLFAAGFRSRSAVLEPRIFLGYAWATGSPIDRGLVKGSSRNGFVAAATLAGGVRAELLPACEILLDIEVGHTLSGLTFLSDADRVAGLSGVLVDALVGLAFRP